MISYFYENDVIIIEHQKDDKMAAYYAFNLRQFWGLIRERNLHKDEYIDWMSYHGALVNCLVSTLKSLNDEIIT